MIKATKEGKKMEQCVNCERPLNADDLCSVCNAYTPRGMSEVEALQHAIGRLQMGAFNDDDVRAIETLQALLDGALDREKSNAALREEF